MTPYSQLRAAVRRKGGICTPWEVRRELQAYLIQFRVKCPIDWSQIMTREEWFASVTKKKKRPRRKKGDPDPVLYVYDTVEDERVEARLHSPTLDSQYAADFEWLDEFVKRQEGDMYYGEF